MAKTKLVLGFLVLSLLPVTFVLASPDTVKWTRVNIPADGQDGNWATANSSDVKHLTMAADGTLYAYANPSGTSYTLFKSTDGGYGWSYTGKVEDTIVDIATAPDEAEVIYYATSANVFKSTDGGKKFTQLASNPGGAGSNNIEITSIDAAGLDENYIVAVGTRDTDSSEYGGVYTLEDGQFPPTWTNISLGNYDVYAVAFSPDYQSGGELVAVSTDETDTFISTKVNSEAWNASFGTAELKKDNNASVAVDTSADIAFPSDHTISENRILFAAIDAGSDNGDVYQIELQAVPQSSTATDLDIGSVYGSGNIDVTSLAISGDTYSAILMAGAATSAQVYYSTDDGKNWARSTKEPSGQSKTYVLMASDFVTTGKAYAATGGTESAFSITQDFKIWNQVSLIDTSVTSIVDIAPSPGYSQDNALFLLTFDGAHVKHSLWRSSDGGTRWERVYSSALDNVDSISGVNLPAQYGNDSQTVLIAGKSGGKSAIWQSTDNGQSFAKRLTSDTDTGSNFNINAWTVVDNDILFVGSFDGSNGVVYYSTNGGWTYSQKATAGSQSLNSIAISPDYEQDKTILVGNTNGWVYWSEDNGASFESLPADVTSAPLSGSITVAFDPEFSKNRTVYAASNTADQGVYRFVIDKDTSWESINTSLPSGGKLSQLVASTDGTLYAANLKSDGGMERSLNPTYSLGPTFETVTRGLEDSAILDGLWLSDNRLWTIDSQNVRLMSYIDSLTQPVMPGSPSNDADGIGTIINYNISNVSLDWETLEGATEYEWQLDYDTDFSTVPSGFEGETKASSARLPALDPNTAYYWRVRASEPVLSPWSEKWTFITSFGSESASPELLSPKPGADEVPLQPLFQWSAVGGADGYELVVSTTASFDNPTILKIENYALSSTAWHANVNLNHDTTYFWKVRAVNSDTRSDWSAVGAFTTESLPSTLSPEPTLETPSVPPITIVPLPPPAPPAPPPTTTSPPTQTPIPYWMVYLLGGMILVMILLAIIMLVLVSGTRRT